VGSSLRRNTEAFYQRLLLGVRSFTDLGNKLIHQAQIAHAFRHTTVVEEAATILCTLPITERESAP